jgi:hypothetical protein
MTSIKVPSTFPKVGSTKVLIEGHNQGDYEKINKHTASSYLSLAVFPCKDGTMLHWALVLHTRVPPVVLIYLHIQTSEPKPLLHVVCVHNILHFKSSQPPWTYSLLDLWLLYSPSRFVHHPRLFRHHPLKTMIVQLLLAS